MGVGLTEGMTVDGIKTGGMTVDGIRTGGMTVDGMGASGGEAIGMATTGEIREINKQQVSQTLPRKLRK